MSRLKQKYIRLDNTSDGVNSQVLPTSYTPTNYTSTDNFAKGHLQGIDNKLGTIVAVPGDISETSFSFSNNSAGQVTGFVFSNAVVRSFSAIASVSIDATSDLFEAFELKGIRRGSDWQMSVTSLGDNSQVTFDIASNGQISYTTGNYAGFVSGTIHFRAQVTSI